MSTNKTFTIEHRGCRLAYNVRGDGAPVLFIQVEIADTSHGVPIERPEHINNLLLDHLAQAGMAAHETIEP